MGMLDDEYSAKSSGTFTFGNIDDALDAILNTTKKATTGYFELENIFENDPLSQVVFDQQPNANTTSANVYPTMPSNPNGVSVNNLMPVLLVGLAYFLLVK